MRAVVVEPGAEGGLGLGEVDEPRPLPSEAVVEVRAVSLNRGEVRMAQGKEAGARIGWDVAGVVKAAAVDGSGPQAGARVVAFVTRADGWAERVAVPTTAMYEIPTQVRDATAAALPVAGLTALRGLDQGTRLTGRPVAITGATGGVGSFAVQIARAMGAEVVAQVRRAAQVEAVEALGAHHVVVSEDGAGFERHAPYALAFDGLGGEIFGRLVGLLDDEGVAVTYGGTAETQTSFGVYDLPRTASIYGFSLYNEIRFEPASKSLQRLLWLVRQGQVEVNIGHTAGWEDVGAVARALLDRDYTGKGILTLI